MSGYIKVIVVLAAIVAIEVAWLARWQVIPVQTKPVAYELDRWTGSVYLLDPSLKVRVLLTDE